MHDSEHIINDTGDLLDNGELLKRALYAETPYGPYYHVSLQYAREQGKDLTVEEYEQQRIKTGKLFFFHDEIQHKRNNEKGTVDN